MSVDRHSTGQTVAPRGAREPAPDPSVDRQPTGVTAGSVDHHPMGVMGSKPKREPCRCAAYSWPHRRSGGRCRWPDLPEVPHPTPAGTNRPTGLRRRGVRKWLIAYYRLHPIRDRALIDRVLPVVYAATDRGHFPKLADAIAACKRQGELGGGGGTGPPDGRHRTTGNPVGEARTSALPPC